MTDTAPTDEVVEEVPAEEVPVADAPPAPPIPPEIQARLDEIRAKIEQEEADEAAATQAVLDADAKMVAAKAVCEEVCGPIEAARRAATDPRERAALEALEQEIHAAHKDMVETAHLERSGQSRGDSNPAAPGVTNIEANVSLAGGGSAEATAG